MREFLRHRTYAFALVLAAGLTAVNALLTPGSLSPSSWVNQLAALAPLLLVAVASTPAVLSGGGGLDISLGPVTALVNCILVSWILGQPFWGEWYVAIPLALAFGALAGLVNGVLVTYLRFQPVIATLCTFFGASGAALLVAPQTTTVQGSTWLRDLGGWIGPVPGPAILIGLPLLLWFALSRTAFHRNLYATGSNQVTAFASGVPVFGVRIIAYGFGGLCAGAAALALTSIVQSSQPTAGSAYTLIALAAVALGGTPLIGGRGGVTGSVLGAVCIFQLQALLTAASVPPTWTNAAYGVLLVAGVALGAVVQAVGSDEQGQHA